MITYRGKRIPPWFIAFTIASMVFVAGLMMLFD